MQILPQSLISFFENYLPKWDGQTNQSAILALLSYLPIKPFEGKSSEYPLEYLLTLPDLYPTILQPLETTLRPTNPTSPSTPTLLLTFYTTLLTHWTTHLTSLPTPPHPSQTTTITALTTHLTNLPLTLLTSTPPTQSTTDTILHHYSTYLPLLQPPLSLPLAPPPPQTITLLLLAHPTLPTLNQISSILASYKTTYENATTPDSAPRPAAHVKALNASLMYVLPFQSLLTYHTNHQYLAIHATSSSAPAPSTTPIPTPSAAISPRP